MPKRLPPNNRPWPDNMAYDFGLPSISPTDAEKFIDGLATSERNKAFLRLRYREGKTYNEIADEYGLTSTGVRLAVKTMWEKYGGLTAIPAAPASPSMPTLPVSDLAPQSAATQPITPKPVENTISSLPSPIQPEAGGAARPLSINLASVRRFLSLTVEEFSRPMHIDSGESLINRLESGFSKASGEVLQLICEAWGINRSYLLTGTGEMFEETNGYCDALVRLLRRYLSVATFDRQGQQYWKGSLVDDLGRLIDVRRLTASEMCRVVRVLYDYVDVEQFA